MKHILLAVDGESPSKAATRLVVRLAPKLEATVWVLTVFSALPQGRGTKNQRAREYAAAHELVDDVASELQAAGATAYAEVRSSNRKGIPGEILATAALLDSDVIVVGSRAGGKLTGKFLGSVSVRVAANAECPIIVVPSRALAGGTPEHIVLVVGARGDARPAIAATAELARVLRTSVQVVCFGAADGPDQSMAAQAVAALEAAGIQVESGVAANRRGFGPMPVREVIATGIDLVVIASRGLDWSTEDMALAGALSPARHRNREHAGFFSQIG